MLNGIAVISLVGLVILSGYMDHQVTVVEDNEYLYCEMVQLYEDSNGEHGWPPYKGECQ